MSFTPTDEQVEALRLFKTGESLTLEAGAGCGKSSTLRLLAQSCPNRTGQLVAFNRSVINDATKVMPSSVVCSTAHSLAFRSVGRRFGHRLSVSARMKSQQLARLLRVDPLVVPYGNERKPLAAGFLASHTMRALEVFCQSADADPAESHFPYLDGIDVPYPDGRRSWENNRAVRAHCLPALRRAWADVQDPEGQVPFRHSHYLKAYQLGSPFVAADYLLADEGQDLAPVLIDIIEQQADHCQICVVGDENQSIYGFTGARDALSLIGTKHRATLSASFRFGPAVADVANGLLGRIGTALRLTGAAPWTSVVGPIPEPDAVLCRTNAVAVRTVLGFLEGGRRPALCGGASQVVSFAKAASDLMEGRWVSHPELACFSDWEQVRDYTANDPAGSELRLMVSLVEEFTPPVIIEALERTATEANADVMVSTAHSGKGREWNRVQIAEDFTPPAEGEEMSVEDLRLAYVAATRSRYELDLSAVPHFLAAPKTPIALPLARQV